MKEDLAYLLEANTPVNRDPHYQDAAGFTPLHWAAYLGLTKTVWALSKSCSSYFGSVNYAGNTPAQLAAKMGHTLLAQEMSEMTVKRVSVKCSFVYSANIGVPLKYKDGVLIVNSMFQMQAGWIGKI